MESCHRPSESAFADTEDDDHEVETVTVERGDAVPHTVTDVLRWRTILSPSSPENFKFPACDNIGRKKVRISTANFFKSEGLLVFRCFPCGPLRLLCGTGSLGGTLLRFDSKLCIDKDNAVSSAHTID